MNIPGDSFKQFEWTETNIQESIEHLEMQSTISSKQTMLSYVLSFSFSAMAIIFSIIVSLNPSLWWVALIVSLLAIFVYYCIFKLYDSMALNKTTSEQSCKNMAHYVRVNVVKELSLCDWYIQEYMTIQNSGAECSVVKKERLRYYSDIVERTDKVLLALQKIFVYGYGPEIFGLRNGNPDRVSLFRLEDVITSLHSVMEFLMSEYAAFVSKSDGLSSEAKAEIRNHLVVDTEDNDNSMLSCYNYIVDCVQKQDITKYFQSLTGCGIIKNNL